MKKTLLITFGCSWVYGVGVNYEEGMSIDEYKPNAWDEELCEEYSFRGLIKKNLNVDHINFAQGGSSNQRQFRIAKTFFFSKQFTNTKNRYDNIIVLWGITSTARHDLYSVDNEKYMKISYNTFDKFDPFSKNIEEKEYNHIKGASWPSWEDYNNLNLDNVNLEILKEIVKAEKLHLKDVSKFTTFEQLFSHVLAKFSWDIDASIYEISLEIKLLSNFFESNNINFLWFDLFNHHDYKKSFTKFTSAFNSENFELKNFLHFNNKSRDLLSLILKNNNSFVDDLAYHLSMWADDNKKITMGVKKKLLNPISFHPTKLGHIEIAKVLQPEIEKFI